jgi:hypothetical protein
MEETAAVVPMLLSERLQISCQKNLVKARAGHGDVCLYSQLLREAEAGKSWSKSSQTKA